MLTLDPLAAKRGYFPTFQSATNAAPELDDLYLSCKDKSRDWSCNIRQGGFAGWRIEVTLCDWPWA
jgi:hypothetical protein